MTSNLNHKATALVLAVMVTIGVLAGLDALAASEVATAQTLLALTTARQAV